MCLLVMQTLIPRALRRALDLLPQAQVPSLSCFTLFLGIMSYTQLTGRGNGLTCLATHLLAHVAYAFALIRLGG